MARRGALLALFVLVASSGLLLATGQDAGLEATPAAADDSCGVDLRSASEEVASLQKQVAALELEAKINQERIASLQSEIDVLTASISEAEAATNSHAAELAKATIELSALRLEHAASPVPAHVVLAFAKLRELQAQAAAFWTAHVQPQAAVALEKAEVYYIQGRAWVATQAGPAWELALAKARAAAASAHASLASHETLGPHYLALGVHAEVAKGKACAAVHKAKEHAAVAVAELEALLTTQLRRFPSTTPLAVKPYPAFIVKSLLFLPLVALLLSILGGGKGKRAASKATGSDSRSARKHKNKKH